MSATPDDAAEGSPEEAYDAIRAAREAQLWDSIVANYGDRPESSMWLNDEEPHYEPPAPPPVPVPRLPRLLAWIGVLGVPVAALVFAMAQTMSESIWVLPDVVSFGLFAWFISGFAYLISQMRRTDSDADDDGAQV